MPDEKPSSSIASTLRSRRLCSTSRQPGRAGGTGAGVASEVVVIVHRVGRMVGEARSAQDRAGAQPVVQARGRELVVDAPADVVFARGAAVAPPGVVLALGVQRAVGVDPAGAFAA